MLICQKRFELSVF